MFVWRRRMAEEGEDPTDKWVQNDSLHNLLKKKNIIWKEEDDHYSVAGSRQLQQSHYWLYI